MPIDTIANIKFDKEIISYLSVLKPAAVMILLAPSETDLKDIIRLTVLDLTLKKVLSIQRKEVQLHPSDPYKRLRTFVETDTNFNTYRKSVYETYFTGIIDEYSYFHLYSYVFRVYDELPVDNTVKKSIIKEQKIRNLFSIVFVFDTLSVFRLNRNGVKIRNEIIRYIVTIEQNLEQIIEDSPKQALHLVSFLKGNFFLLRNIPAEVLEKLNNLIQLHKKELKDEYFDLFDIFEFSDIFFSDISEEIKELLEKIESSYSSIERGSSDINPRDLYI